MNLSYQFIYNFWRKNNNSNCQTSIAIFSRSWVFWYLGLIQYHTVCSNIHQISSVLFLYFSNECVKKCMISSVTTKLKKGEFYVRPLFEHQNGGMDDFSQLLFVKSFNWWIYAIILCGVLLCTVWGNIFKSIHLQTCNRCYIYLKILTTT